MKLYALALCAVFISGCQTKQIQEMSYSEKQKLAGEIVQRCVDQGVKSGTAEMAACTQSEVIRENYTRQKNEIQLRRGMAAIGTGLSNASQSYSAAARSPAMTPTTVTCRRNPAPTGYTSMSCY